MVHLGTISKALFPGVRVGWISGPKEFVHRLAALKRVGELTSPPVLQAALNLFLVRGDYDRHLAKMRSRLKHRLALAHRTLVNRFPIGTRVERPSGGYVLWAELPPGVSGRALAAAAREKGVLLSAGAEFMADQSDVQRDPDLRRARVRFGPREGPRDRGRGGARPRPAGRAPAKESRARSPRSGAGRRSGSHPDLRKNAVQSVLPEILERALNMTPISGFQLTSPFSSDEFRVKVGLAEMLKGGVIMDVVDAEQAKIAEDAGAAAVMALERVPADIRREGGVARMSPVAKIREIEAAVSIPVMAKCRIGHLAEARILESLEVDFIDESEVLTPADDENHVYKHDFKVPFVCGCRNLGEALRRIGEGAAMIRTKGEAGTGDIVHAVKHLREVTRQIKALTLLTKDEWMAAAKNLGAPFELVAWVATYGRLPVPNFAAGGIATPADAALCRMLGAEAVFVGSGIFKSSDPAKRARAIVEATTHFQDPGADREGVRGPRRGHEGHRGREAHRGRAAPDPRLVSGDRGPRSPGRFRGARRRAPAGGCRRAGGPRGGRDPEIARASSSPAASRRRSES